MAKRSVKQPCVVQTGRGLSEPVSVRQPNANARTCGMDGTENVSVVDGSGRERVIKKEYPTAREWLLSGWYARIIIIVM